MPLQERIIEEEQSIEPQYDGSFDYSLEESGDLSAKGKGQGKASSSLTFLLLSLKSSGASQTFSVANLVIPGDFIASGIGELDNTNATMITNLYSIVTSGEGEGIGKGSLVGFLYLNASSTNDSDGFASLSFPIDTSALGLGEGIGNATTFEYITALTAQSLGFGDGTSDITIDSKSQEELDKRQESFFIGDVEIPLLVSKDVSVERETIVKEFVRDEPQFFQESSDFESGSYSAFLNQENHSEGKTLEEQIHDVRKLIERQPEQNEVDYADGKGYAVVNSVGDVIDVDEEIKEVEIDVIILEDV